MKCSNCGANLEDGAAFCRECGAKVIMRKKFCRECGAELADGVKFCSNCGASVSMKSFGVEDSNVEASSTTDDIQSKIRSSVNRYQRPLKQNMKGTNAVPDLNDSLSAKGAKRKQQNQSKRFLPVLTVIFVFCILIAVIGNLDSNNKNEDRNTDVASATASSREAVSESTNYSIVKGTEYAFMSDEWNVYIATAVSDSIIKVEHWDKTLQTTKDMSFSEDIGTFKINDKENGFSWIDDKQTAFKLIFKDKNNSRVKKAEAHVFTVNISDSDKFKGTDYDKSIASYTYTCDDWHMYRAIPLTDKFIKIECWARTSSLDKFCYGWDWCVINTKDNDVEFEWTDDEHTSFTITAQDTQNKSYWKEPSFVLFEIENSDYKYSTIADYLGYTDAEAETTVESVPIEETSIEKENVMNSEASSEVNREAASDDMPVMPGSLLENATEKAKKFGVTVLYDDDFGHGTRCTSYSDSSGGLMIDIIYSSNTKEILCATITTNKLSSQSEQHNFIKEMAGVVCPSSDVSTVTDWVNNSVGGNETTEVNGFTYEVSLGPVDNALYSAGEKNWESWELAQ